MNDNKLFEIINCLTGVEKRELTKYLNSPYFNQRDDVQRLWKFILANRTQEFNAETAFAFVYPGEDWDIGQWRYVQSFLLQQIEQFMAQRAVESLPLLSDLHLIAVYRQKNLRKPLDYVFRRAGERLDKMPRDLQYYHFQYQLESEKYAAVDSQARTKENNLALINRTFDVFAFASKLRLACLMESHRAVYKTEYDTTLLDAMLPLLEAGDWLEIPLIAIYYHCYQALRVGHEDNFQAFRREIAKLSPGFPQEERRTFLLLAINFCIRRLNSGELHYLQEAFNFYQIGLESGALLENGHIGRFGFKNIVALSLKLGKAGWAETFIEEYAPLLEDKYRETHRDFNLAKVYYTQKNYEKAMPLLARVDESDLLLNLDGRIILLKMYYEIEAWDALDALISSFKILLLRKKKIIGYHHLHYMHTLRFLQKLTRLNARDKNAVEKLRNEVRASKVLIERDWILERLDSL